MSISSALNSGVAGLNANGVRLASISDNIANSSTFGYKRVRTDFSSLVMPNSSPGSYSAGGVRSSVLRLIDERGPLVTTDNATDMAVAGRGFIPVVEAARAGQTPVEMMLTTTGSFFPDADGMLRTDTGLVLLGWPAQRDGTIPGFPRDTAGGLEPVQIPRTQGTADPTTQVQLGVNLPATATREGADADPIVLSLEYFDNLGVAGQLRTTLTPTPPVAPVTATNSWTMEVVHVSTGDVLGEYTLLFSDTPADGGRLQTVTPIGGSPAYDPVTGRVPLTIGAGPGAQDISIGIGDNDTGRGMTQLSDRFAPIAITKDGAPVGSLVSVQVDPSGRIDAVYDSGIIRTVYQVPVVDVPNPNGLDALSNQLFRVSRDSGPFFLWDAGSGPVGSMAGFAREQSTTDVATELTNLIQTQRAYSSNAKVVQTTDEMLQETTNLKR